VGSEDFSRRRRRRRYHSAPRIRRRATPPIRPPTIAPVFGGDGVAWGVEVVVAVAVEAAVWNHWVGSRVRTLFALMVLAGVVWDVAGVVWDVAGVVWDDAAVIVVEERESGQTPSLRQGSPMQQPAKVCEVVKHVQYCWFGSEQEVSARRRRLIAIAMDDMVRAEIECGRDNMVQRKE